jgi:hypothetical protein
VVFRLDPDIYGEFRSKIQFTTAAWMPYKIYEACKATGIISNTRYCQIAVCEKLAKDLNVDLNELLDALPKPRTFAAHLFNPLEKRPGVEPSNPKQKYSYLYEAGSVRHRIGAANTIEEVD